ncbi:MAG: fumarate reductase subunit C [Actinomycetes bacterium]
MSAQLPSHTDYHPRWYRERVPIFWWLRRRSYVAFVLREMSCVFVAWSVVFLLLLVRAVGQGPGSYSDFLDWADTLWVVVLNVVSLAFLVYHAVTWFQLTPRAMVLKLSGRPVPGRAIATSAFAGWAVVSAFVTWLLLRG